MGYSPDSKCINVGCEAKAQCMWKCKPCYNRDRKYAGCGVQTPEQRKAYRQAHKEEIASYNAQWSQENKVHRRIYTRDRNRQNPEPNRQRVRRWAKENPEKHRAYRLMRDFNLTMEQYQEMWQAQGGKCLISGTDLQPTGQKRDSVAVDHCHKTGAIRGLLCSHCNKGIGHFDDDPAKLRAAADYLEAAKRGKS